MTASTRVHDMRPERSPDTYVRRVAQTTMLQERVSILQRQLAELRGEAAGLQSRTAETEAEREMERFKLISDLETAQVTEQSLRWARVRRHQQQTWQQAPW
jgi:predicted  nucleic acid-binding Zn-ribbon protein